MATPSGDLGLQVIFGRAFLLELQRGNLQRATVFARAFLRRHAPGRAASTDSRSATAT